MHPTNTVRAFIYDILGHYCGFCLLDVKLINFSKSGKNANQTKSTMYLLHFFSI